jgi:heme A synthase
MNKSESITPQSASTKNNSTTRKFRILLVLMLVTLAIQGWLGDTVNIFYAPASGVTPPTYTMAGFFGEVQSAGYSLVSHTVIGIILVILSGIVLGLSFRWSKSRAVRITSALGFLSVVSAAVGGFFFVMSGFANGGNSAQMGGSFISAFALFFLALFYAK